MENKESLEELLEEEDFDAEEKDPEEIKRKVQLVEDELSRLSDIKWDYAKSLLKFGFSAWFFGFSAYIASLLILEGPGFILDAPPLALSLLILAGAAPVIISVIFVFVYGKRMGRLDRLRSNLLSRYEKTLLELAKEDID